MLVVFRFLRMRHTSSLRARLRLTFDSIAEFCRLTTMSAPRNCAAASAAVASCELQTCAMRRVLANLALFHSLGARGDSDWSRIHFN